MRRAAKATSTRAEPGIANRPITIAVTGSVHTASASRSSRGAPPFSRSNAITQLNTTMS